MHFRQRMEFLTLQSLSAPLCPPYLNVDRDMMRNMASGPLQKNSTLKCGGAGGDLQSLRMTTNILSHITDCSVKNSTLGTLEEFFRVLLFESARGTTECQVPGWN